MFTLEVLIYFALQHLKDLLFFKICYQMCRLDLTCQVFL